MRDVVSRYVSFGASLSGFGAAVSLVSYFVLFSVPFTALGIACVILGLAAVTLPEQPVPKRAVRSLLQGATLSVEALLEEFDARERAVYLPPREGLVIAYVPLSTNPHPPTPESVYSAPRRVVTEVDGVPILTLFPPGAEVTRAAELSEEYGLEQAIAYILTEVTELCSSVRVAEQEGIVIVEMKGVKVKTEAGRYVLSLGSIPSSLAACTIATVKKRAVTLESEENEKGMVLARFRLV